MSPSQTIPSLKPGRSCDECALCCKLGEIPGVKSFNNWCEHCTTRKGCDIYEQRPQLCRHFFCYYLIGDAGEHWKPLDCGMVIAAYANPKRVIISVDPSRPDIWREQPYIRDILDWSARAQLTVMVGYRSYAVTPEGIDDLGDVTEEYTVLTIEEETPHGTRRRFRRVLRSEADEMVAAINHPCAPSRPS